LSFELCVEKRATMYIVCYFNIISGLWTVQWSEMNVKLKCAQFDITC
jgi:hypothetical protein